MDKHCKGCKHFHSAGRRNPPIALKKYNAWCCAKGAPVDTGWCKAHNVKELLAAKPGEKP